ncbi:sterile alpha motif domain-containing protein 9-like [Ptychodera flava]|uniref:sterile alpha motif domain-containing protein 9-like n=1 Tax=Ptychodera flava TaxID=63121 RepID=UPI003969D4E3
MNGEVIRRSLFDSNGNNSSRFAGSDACYSMNRTAEATSEIDPVSTGNTESSDDVSTQHETVDSGTSLAKKENTQSHGTSVESDYTSPSPPQISVESSTLPSEKQHSLPKTTSQDSGASVPIAGPQVPTTGTTIYQIHKSNVQIGDKCQQINNYEMPLKAELKYKHDKQASDIMLSRAQKWFDDAADIKKNPEKYEKIFKIFEGIGAVLKEIAPGCLEFKLSLPTATSLVLLWDRHQEFLPRQLETVMITEEVIKSVNGRPLQICIIMDQMMYNRGLQFFATQDNLAKLSSRRPKKMKDWNAKDVRDWLNEIGIDTKYVKRIYEEEITGPVLMMYREKDLEADFNLKKGALRNIMYSRENQIENEARQSLQETSIDKSYEQSVVSSSTNDNKHPEGIWPIPSAGDRELSSTEGESALKPSKSLPYKEHRYLMQEATPHSSTIEGEEQNKASDVVKREKMRDKQRTEQSEKHYIDVQEKHYDKGIVTSFTRAKETRSSSFESRMEVLELSERATEIRSPTQYSTQDRKLKEYGSQEKRQDSKFYRQGTSEQDPTHVQPLDQETSCIDALKARTSEKMVDVNIMQSKDNDDDVNKQCKSSTSVSPNSEKQTRKHLAIVSPYVGEQDKGNESGHARSRDTAVEESDDEFYQKMLRRMGIKSSSREVSSSQTHAKKTSLKTDQGFSKLKDSSNKQHKPNITQSDRRLKELLCGGSKQIDASLYPLLVINKPAEEIFKAGVDTPLSRDLQFVSSVKWVGVFDLDAESYESGLCKLFRRKNDIKAQSPETFCNISEVGCFRDSMRFPEVTTWIFANGRTDMVEEALDRKQWNAVRSNGVEDAISFFAKPEVIPDLKRATILFLLLSDNLGIMCDTFRKFYSTFGIEHITCIAEKEEYFVKWADEIEKWCCREMLEERSVVGMSWQAVKESVMSIQGVIHKTDDYLPSSSGSSCPLSERDRNRWSDLSILCQNECENTTMADSSSGFEEFAQSMELDFYRGHKVSWWNFHLTGKKYNQVLKRDIHEQLHDMVDASLRENQDSLPRVVLLRLFHQPGAGGSTLARHILWDFHKKFRCLVVNHIRVKTWEQFLRCANTERSILGLQTVLVLVEDAEDTEINELIYHLESGSRTTSHQAGCPLFVVLHCKRVHSPYKHMVKCQNTSIKLEQELSSREIRWFAEKHRELDTKKAKGLQIYSPDRLVSFMVMKDNFKRDYVENLVSRILQDIPSDKGESHLLKFCALLNKYEPDASIPVSCLDAIMGGE